MPKRRNQRTGSGVKVTISILTVAVIAVIALLLYQNFIAAPATQYGNGGTKVNTAAGVVNCPTGLQTTITPTLYNVLNNTVSEKDNATLFFVPVVKGVEQPTAIQTSISDGSATVTLTCGAVYDVKIESSSTDTANIVSYSGDAGIADSSLNNGVLTFTASGPSGALTLKANQYGNPQIRAFDVVNNNYMYNVSANSATSYSTGTVYNFTSITNNATATAVGVSGSYDVKFDIQSQDVAHTMNDQGIYVLVDEASSVWQVPAVYLNGNLLTNIKGSLSSSEAIAYSGDEYVYMIPAGTNMVNPAKMTLEIASNAISGVNPTSADAPVFYLSAIGTYPTVSNANVLASGAVDDTTSHAQVHTLVTLNNFIS
jgi:hypothetical protein